MVKPSQLTLHFTFKTFVYHWTDDYNGLAFHKPKKFVNASPVSRVLDAFGQTQLLSLLDIPHNELNSVELDLLVASSQLLHDVLVDMFLLPI